MMSFLRFKKKSESSRGQVASNPTTEISTATTAIMVDDSAQPASPAKIIIHFVRHAEAYNNDITRPVQDRLNHHDPMINNYGVAQCASLCMSFARMDKVTHILSSPLQRSIMTASHAFRPITDRGVKVLLVPGLREVNGSFRCNQGSPIKFLAWQQAEIRKVPINFSLVKAQKGWELIDYTPILETHAFDTIEMIYNMAKEFIKKGELNAEGNVELLVVGHAGMLGALIGYDAEERKARPWNNLEIRTFKWIPNELVETDEKKPLDGGVFEEGPENNMAHIRPYSCPTYKQLTKKGWNPKEIAIAESGLKRRLEREKEQVKKEQRDEAKREARDKIIATETPEQKVKREAKEEKQLTKQLKKANKEREDIDYRNRVRARIQAEKDKARAKRTAKPRFRLPFRLPFQILGEDVFTGHMREAEAKHAG